jgi:hypothetical protein
MRTPNLIFSAVQFIFVVMLVLIGSLFLGFAHAPQFRYTIAQFFTEHSSSLSAMGWGIIGFACLLACGFFAMNRGSYYRIEMQRHQAGVEPEVVCQYVQSYWSEIFPELSGKTAVVLHGKRKIEIIAHIPNLNEEDFNCLLPKIEEELGILLAHAFGYRREFLLTLTLP